MLLRQEEARDRGTIQPERERADHGPVQAGAS